MEKYNTLSPELRAAYDLYAEAKAYQEAWRFGSEPYEKYTAILNERMTAFGRASELWQAAGTRNNPAPIEYAADAIAAGLF